MENHGAVFLVIFVCSLIGCQTERLTHRDLPTSLKNVLANQNSKKLAALSSHPPAAGSLTASSQEGEICQDWANWCLKYKPYCSYTAVNKHCKKTCGLCPKIKEECKDIHPQCPTGKQYGYCTGSQSQVDFMKKYCPESCQFCKTTSDCTDKSEKSYCDNIREQGLCHKPEYRLFLKERCQKTCELCERTDNCGVAKRREYSNTKGVVGGNNTEKGFFPWQAAIYYESKLICGGTLIGKKYILTAAHCFNGRSTDVRKYQIVLGEHNRLANEDTEEKYYVNDIRIHEEYSRSHDDHDITLIQLIRNVETTDDINPACLPYSQEALSPGTKCYITGWGYTSIGGSKADILQELKVPVAERSHCEKRNAFNFHEVTDKMICTGYDDGENYSSACHGDSGGPLSCERSPGVWSVFGVVSWGSPLCNGLDRYTVFTRVSSYIDWIKRNTSS